MLLRLDLGDLDQRAGQAGQFGGVVQHLDPVQFVQAEHVVAAQAGGADLVVRAVHLEFGHGDQPPSRCRATI